MEDIVSYQFTQVKQRRDDRHEIEYELILRQQPKQSRMCGIGEKADRRPIDPPPIIQLKVYDSSLAQNEKSSSFLQNPYFFMYASLMAPDTDEELHLLRDGKTRSTTGSVVSSLYHLKDIDNSDAGFFVFPDLSVRMEGNYRLKLSLFEIIGREVYHCKSIFSDIFTVYSAKRFPGMEESTFLSRSFADQGLKIRIRKEIRIRRRLNKRKDAEEGSPESSSSKRIRADGDNNATNSDGSDDEMRDPTPGDNSKVSSETSQSKAKEVQSPSSPRERGHYEMPHHPYDPYGYGRSWHDTRDYMGEHPPHYPPYHDPYDRRYHYPYPYPYPYYPPHMLPESAEHHRYPYPPMPYGRPPMHPGYYSESQSSSKPPYPPYDPTNPYPGYPPRGASWPPPHYGDRSPTSGKEEPSSPHYRASGPMTPPPLPRGAPGMYPPYPPEYYPYPPPPPPHGIPKPEYGLGPGMDQTMSVPPGQHGPTTKIPIQNLLTGPEQHDERTNPSRGYPGPSPYIHPPYNSSSRPPDYPGPPYIPRPHEPYPYHHENPDPKYGPPGGASSSSPTRQSSSQQQQESTKAKNDDSPTSRLPASEPMETEPTQGNRGADFSAYNDPHQRPGHQGSPPGNRLSMNTNNGRNDGGGNGNAINARGSSNGGAGNVPSSNREETFSSRRQGVVPIAPAAPPSNSHAERNENNGRSNNESGGGTNDRFTPPPPSSNGTTKASKTAEKYSYEEER